MENKIQLKGVSKSFQTFNLEDITLNIPKGYIIGFVGKNGAGKTTTIKSILSLINLDRGEILYERNYKNKNNFLQDVGIVMDEPFLSKDWDINIVNSVMKIGYENWDSKAFYEYIDKFDINSNLKVKELSRGMKIKLMLAIALSHEANTLILDEPTSGLDPSMRDEFTDIMKDFVEDENHTVLFSTHITQDLEAIADYIVFIADGKLVSFETKDDFIDKYIIVKGYKSQLENIPAEIICGKKISEMGFECLIYKDMVERIDKDLSLENPSIDKIIVFYGREK